MKGCSIDIGTSGTHAGVKGTTTVWIFTRHSSHSYPLTWSALIPFLHLCIVTIHTETSNI